MFKIIKISEKIYISVWATIYDHHPSLRPSQSQFNFKPEEITDAEIKANIIMGFQMLLLANTNSSQYFIEITPENIEMISKKLERIVERSGTIWSNFEWMLLELGDETG